MGSRGRLGGLSAAAPQAIRVLQAAGYQVILVETVGVGQAEVAIASAADVLVVNKADRPETQATVRDLRTMVSLAQAAWRPPTSSPPGLPTASSARTRRPRSYSPRRGFSKLPSPNGPWLRVICAPLSPAFTRT